VIYPFGDYPKAHCVTKPSKSSRTMSTSSSWCSFSCLRLSCSSNGCDNMAWVAWLLSGPLAEAPQGESQHDLRQLIFTVINRVGNLITYQVKLGTRLLVKRILRKTFRTPFEDETAKNPRVESLATNVTISSNDGPTC
jgi:hypothetical protein